MTKDGWMDAHEWLKAYNAEEERQMNLKGRRRLEYMMQQEFTPGGDTFSQSDSGRGR